jgi:hypothetical protein
LRSVKVIFSLLKKLWIEKTPFQKIQPFIYKIFIYQSSNNGIYKFDYTLKGVAWIPYEDASPVGNRRRICINFSIISFLFYARASLRNILKGPPASSSFF